MEFPPGLLSNAPQLDTRRALLIIDLQNDFVANDGKLPIENVPEFIPTVAKLASRFREDGEVVWVQSVFEESRPTLDPMSGSYSVFLKEFLPEEESSSSSFDDDIEDDDLPATLRSLAAPTREPSRARGKPDPEAFLAPAINKADRCCMPGQFGSRLVPELVAVVDSKRDIISTKSHYGALTNNPLLLNLRVRLVTELYLCGSLSNVAVYATAVEAVTHGFKVTIIEDCVGYQDEKIHEEAMRQMADVMGAFGITSSELIDDLDGITSEEEEPTTNHMLDAHFGTAAISTESLTLRPKVEDWIATVEQEDEKNIHKTQSKPSHGIDIQALTDDHDKQRKPLLLGENAVGFTAQKDGLPSASPPRKRSISEVDFPQPNLNSSPRSSDNQQSQDVTDRDNPNQITQQIRIRPRKSSKSKHNSTEMDSIKAQALKDTSTSSHSISSSHQDLLSESTTTTHMDNKLNCDRDSICKIRKSTRHIPGPADLIGEGDCQIIYKFLDDCEDESLFHKLDREVHWQKMYHRSGEVPRLVAVQGLVEADGSTPIYRHPADESPPLLPFVPTVMAICTEAEKAVGHPLNHVLIQLYRNGEDNISEHSDKTLDIVRGSKIVNYSIGAQRTMTLRTKKVSSDSAGSLTVPIEKEPSLTTATPGPPRESQRIPLPHNSLFILGPSTNMSWLHSIRADKRSTKDKMPEELAYNQTRISLTFRHIGTYLNHDAGTIWGQGATSKSKSDAQSIVEGDDAAVEKLVRAFGQENHQGREFDWDKWYGGGFDVVNFATKGKGDKDESSA